MTKTREDWQPIETLPKGRKVLIKTATGLERIAKRGDYRVKQKDQWGPKRIHCWRQDRSGDLMAIAWRELRAGREDTRG